MSVFSEFLLRMRPISESPAVSIKRDFSIKTCNEPCQGCGGGSCPVLNGASGGRFWLQVLGVCRLPPHFCRRSEPRKISPNSPDADSDAFCDLLLGQ